MFGHQDEPQSTNGPAATPATATPASGSFDTSFVTPASAPATPALLDASATDGITAPDPVASSAPAVSNDKLLDIKQQALQQLSPLVGHLEQSPEEKFRTTMMMIQAADNQDLIGQAYEAAQAISDEKARAQALLDIINEINYFTQQQAK